MKEAEIGIQFDLSKIDLDELRKIETLLYEANIGFDTGIGFGYRDWEWDWSISGPVKIRVKNLEEPDNNIIVVFDLLANKQMFNIIEIERRFEKMGIKFDITIDNNYRYWNLKEKQGAMEVFFKRFKGEELDE